MTNPVRRSSRSTWANYTSFGRDYLAEALGWSRLQLNKWLLSSTVHPHLVFWHSTCIDRACRYNEGVEWINTGYFLQECNLEEDILLLCLGEGEQSSNEDADGEACGMYADTTARTCKWTTIELWARTVWRIVQNNCGPGTVFEKAMKFHPAAAYGVTFDILTLAFHNIASVGPESVWATIINSAYIPTLALTPCNKPTSVRMTSIIARQIAMDTDPDASSEIDIEHFEEVLEDFETENISEGSEFSSEAKIESESMFVETPKRKRGASSRRYSTPVRRVRGNKRAYSDDGEEETPSKRVERWMEFKTEHY